jgi:predicted ATPase
MIRQVTVSNFRSIGPDTHLHLGRITALVGPNGSGKSALVDVLRFVSDTLHTGLEAAVTKRHGITALRRWSAGKPFDLRLEVTIEKQGQTGFYRFVLAGDRAEEYRVKLEEGEYGDGFSPARFKIEEGIWKEGPAEARPPVDRMGLALPLLGSDLRFRPLLEELKNVAIYSIYPDILREPQKPNPKRPMDEHGGNWSSILKGLKKEDWGPDLKAALGKLTGDIVDIRVEAAGGYLIVQFQHNGSEKGPKNVRGRWFESAQESDGTLRFAGILTALLQEPPLTLIGVEEPELTIHPGAIPLIRDYLDEASRRCQILITTHSPDLLSLLRADDVRVVERRNGITTVQPMDKEQREAVRQKLLTLGDVLRMEGLRQADPETCAPSQSELGLD